MEQSEKTLDMIVNLCKNRGYVFPGSEIYGGLANSWDYGPLGVEFKNNVKKAWLKKFVQESPYNVGLDAAIIMNPQTWVTTGHVSSFSDPLLDCRACKARHRADKLIGEEHPEVNVDAMSFDEMDQFIADHEDIVCPVCGKHDFTPIRKFNLMFKTAIGVTEDSSSTCYLRPETAQGIFVNFANIQRTTRRKLPFGEFSNYSARFNTPAKLNNFTLTFDEIDKLAEQIALIKAIAEYVTFKTDCANNVSYLSNIEFIDLGANFKQKLEAAKDEFRSARDSILTDTSGDAAAQKVNAALEKVKEEYIGIYFEEHKKKRLDIDDAKRRGKLQESLVLANLRKLRGVEILSAAKLTKIEQDMANLKVCYELTPTELKTTHICPHCHYNLGDQVPNVAGQLDNLDIRIDDLVTEWTQTLLNTISDPIVASQKEYLSAEQQKAIDDFIASGTLPKRVDDFFIKAIQALLKGFEPVVVDAKDLMDKLMKLPPMDEVSFKLKLNELIAGYTKGKDEGKLRIIVK